jgi:hypothetical protein
MLSEYPHANGYVSFVPLSGVAVALRTITVKVTLRPTASRPVCLRVRHPSGSQDLFFPFFFFVLTVAGFFMWGHPLWREAGSLIYSYSCFWALPEQSLLGRSTAELRPYYTVSFEAPPTWRASSPYLSPPGTGWPSYTPGHWVPFLSSLTSRRATVEVF